jgi:hypothetical protein
VNIDAKFCNQGIISLAKYERPPKTYGNPFFFLAYAIAVLIKIAYPKFCYDDRIEIAHTPGECLYLQKPQKVYRNYRYPLPIATYQLSITNYPLPDIPHLFEGCIWFLKPEEA